MNSFIQQQPFFLCSQILWIRNLDRALQGWVASAPLFAPGLKAWETELSGAFFIHMSGTWDGITRRRRQNSAKNSGVLRGTLYMCLEFLHWIVASEQLDFLHGGSRFQERKFEWTKHKVHDLVSGITHCHFCHTPLVKKVTSPPWFRRRRHRPPPTPAPVGGVSRICSCVFKTATDYFSSD